MVTYTPEQISAFWSGVGAIATAAAAIVAIITLLALKKDSHDRTRPVMGAYLQAHPLSHGTSEFVVTNFGPTAACDITVTFDPPLPKLEGPQAAGKLTPYLQQRYDQVIPTVAPAMKLINLYQVGGDSNDEPVPDDFTVTFAYTDMGAKNRYEEAYRLSVQTLRNSSTTAPADKPDGSDMPKRQVKALEAIARGLGRK